MKHDVEGAIRCGGVRHVREGVCRISDEVCDITLFASIIPHFAETTDRSASVSLAGLFGGSEIDED